jgi:hypothetical protein
LQVLVRSVDRLGVFRGAVAVGGTTIALNLASQVTIPAAAVIVITQYTEVLAKLNFGVSSYYTATAA